MSNLSIIKVSFVICIKTDFLGDIMYIDNETKLHIKYEIQCNLWIDWSVIFLN